MTQSCSSGIKVNVSSTKKHQTPQCDATSVTTYSVRFDIVPRPCHNPDLALSDSWLFADEGPGAAEKLF
jgi:hypothetical protein